MQVDESIVWGYRVKSIKHVYNKAPTDTKGVPVSKYTNQRRIQLVVDVELVVQQDPAWKHKGDLAKAVGEYMHEVVNKAPEVSDGR